MLEHGGKLIQAALQYRIPVANWIDLSTGLNPQPWPVTSPSIDSWACLPDDDDELNQAAREYYGGQSVLPVAGSQAAIQMVPRIHKLNSRIAILDPAYAEHAHAWQTSGFKVTPLLSTQIDNAIEHHDVVIIVNPNNPTGEYFSVKQCLDWRKRLHKRGGCLIVDEAFIDCTPEHSLVAYAHNPGLIVLRSLGKFFGLAGARVGFVFSAPPLLNTLAEYLGPWAISGPSRSIAKMALQDVNWQAATREHLIQQGQRLRQLLINVNLIPSGGTALFQWVKTRQAAGIHQHLAKQGILTRLFVKPASLRFGLPATEAQWQRLEQVLLSSTTMRKDNTEYGKV